MVVMKRHTRSLPASRLRPSSRRQAARLFVVLKRSDNLEYEGYSVVEIRCRQLRL